MTGLAARTPLPPKGYSTISSQKMRAPAGFSYEYDPNIRLNTDTGASSGGYRLTSLGGGGGGTAPAATATAASAAPEVTPEGKTLGTAEGRDIAYTGGDVNALQYQDTMTRRRNAASQRLMG